MDVTQLAKLAKTFVDVKSDPEDHGGSAGELLGMNETPQAVSAADPTPAAYVCQKPSDTPAKQGIELFTKFIQSSCKTIPVDATADDIQTALSAGPLAGLVKDWTKGKIVFVPAMIDLSIDHLVMAPRGEVARNEVRPLVSPPPAGKKTTGLAIGHSSQYRMCLRAISFLDREIAKAGGRSDPKILALRQALGPIKTRLETGPIREAEYALGNGDAQVVAFVDAVTLFLTYKKKNVDKIYNYTADDGAMDANHELFDWDTSAQGVVFQHG